MKYDFSHLTQPPNQNVGGPIQDDEALLLYSIVRCGRIRRILEVGGLSGYSANNFLKAISWEKDAKTAVYTCDKKPVKSLAPNHFTFQKSIGDITIRDVHETPLDLIFFDAHVLDPQMAAFNLLREANLITNETIIALHDTGLHSDKRAKWSYLITDSDGTKGYVHQKVERQMVNILRRRYGYDSFSAHVFHGRNDALLPERHGITLMQKYKFMVT